MSDERVIDETERVTSGFPREFLCCILDITPYSWDICNKEYKISLPAVCYAVANHVTTHLNRSPLNFLTLDLVYPLGIKRIYCNLTIENNILQTENSKEITARGIYNKIYASIKEIYEGEFIDEPQRMNKEEAKVLYATNKDENLKQTGMIMDQSGRCPQIGTAFTSVLCYLSRIKQNDSVLKTISVKVLIVNASPFSHAQKLLFISSMFAARKSDYTVNVLSFEKQGDEDITVMDNGEIIAEEKIEGVNNNSNELLALPIFRQTCVILGGYCLNALKKDIHSKFINNITVKEIKEHKKVESRTDLNIERIDLLGNYCDYDYQYGQDGAGMMMYDRNEISPPQSPQTKTNDADLNKEVTFIKNIDKAATVYATTCLQLVDPPNHLKKYIVRPKNTSRNEEKNKDRQSSGTKADVLNGDVYNFYGYCSSCGRDYAKDSDPNDPNSFINSTWFTCSACLAVYCPKCVEKNIYVCSICSTMLMGVQNTIEKMRYKIDKEAIRERREKRSSTSSGIIIQNNDN